MELVNKTVGFDVTYATIRSDGSGTKDLEAALNLGYEPFAVTSYMEMPRQSSPVLAGASPQPVIVDKVWLKRAAVAEKTNNA